MYLGLTARVAHHKASVVFCKTYMTSALRDWAPKQLYIFLREVDEYELWQLETDVCIPERSGTSASNVLA